jgi:hypothetical protein
MDFSGGAGLATNFDVIPKGQLAFAILQVRGVKTSGSGGAYLDCELTIAEGQPYAGRKVWEMIGDPHHAGNSEAYRQMGLIAITRILEAGRGAGPNNPAGYQIPDYSALSGLKVGIKIGIEEGTGGHPDKNRVAEWLTPNPDSQSGHKGWQKLVAGEFSPSGAAQPAATGFGGGADAPGRGSFGGFGGGATSVQNQSGNTGGFGGNNASGFTAPAGTETPSPSTTTSPSEQAGGTPAWLAQAQ